VRLKGGERVYRSRIYERDGWICQLCHKKVDKNLKWPHPMSASLDHIIPAVDDASTHEPTNVQLAHLRCNSLRREVGPAQLILFGEIAA
jgi:5-methylcytosine-specific restriction endonuclease McrA